jgi:hypothetical protein
MHPIENPLVARQPHEIDAGGEVDRVTGIRSGDSPRILKRLGRRPLDDHLSRPVCFAPDDGPAA